MIRIALLLLALLPATAHAEWREAASTNFLVYGDTSEAELRAFATKLEKFNFVLRTYHKVTAPPAPNRLKVYLLPNIAAVGRMAGGAGVAGYYVRRARGPMLVGTLGSRLDNAIDAESILLHEYTHHFMYQYFPATYPTWYSEGFAEFWGSTDLLNGDVVEIGLPADHRFGSFVENRWLPVSKLLTAQSYADVPDLDLLYAEGWLLVRYTFDNPRRREQLQTYLTAVNGGSTYQAAMTSAFGDVGSLNSELRNYAGKARFSALRLPFRAIDAGPIAVRVLRPGEQAMMDLEIQLAQGITQREAAEMAGKVRGTATHHLDDPFVLADLAEAERLAGNMAASAAAIERLLKVDPANPRALMAKGMLQIDSLRTARSTDAAQWQAARQSIARASRAAPNDPLILEAFYDSYALQGSLPPETAQAALYSAMELAPSDGDLRYKVAADFERRGMIEDAIAVIRPVAYVLPSRKEETERERKRREELEEKYREAGHARRESSREMLDRLQEKAKRAAPAASNHSGA